MVLFVSHGVLPTGHGETRDETPGRVGGSGWTGRGPETVDGRSVGPNIFLLTVTVH